MSSTQLTPLPAWAAMQINAKLAWMALLLNRPVTRLFYRTSKADYPLFPLPWDVEVNLYPHGFQQTSLVQGPLLWAKVLNALEDQCRGEDLLKIEQDFIARFGDCLAEKGGKR